MFVEEDSRFILDDGNEQEKSSREHSCLENEPHMDASKIRKFHPKHLHCNHNFMYNVYSNGMRIIVSIPPLLPMGAMLQLTRIDPKQRFSLGLQTDVSSSESPSASGNDRRWCWRCKKWYPETPGIPANQPLNDKAIHQQNTVKTIMLQHHPESMGETKAIQLLSILHHTRYTYVSCTNTYHINHLYIYRYRMGWTTHSPSRW